MTINLLVCGAGHGGHVLAGLASAQPDVTQVRVLTLSQEKARLWNKQKLTVTIYEDAGDIVTVHGNPTIISSDPEEVVPGCNIIVFTLSACVHEKYLTALRPYVSPGTVLVGCPGNAGFELQVSSIWGDLAIKCPVLSFESLPWTCRITEFGKAVAVLCTKRVLTGAISTQSSAVKEEALALCQMCLGESPILELRGHILGITLMGTNAYIHPPIMYETWRDWDGCALLSPPPFYSGIDERSAETMSDISDEIIAIAQDIMQRRADVDLTNVSHIYHWYLKCNGHCISDKSSLFRCLQTNRAYLGEVVPMLHPMKETHDGKYVVDFNHRFIDEDIPYGLVVMKGIAVIAGTTTPTIDKVIAWAQCIMGKEYLVNGEFIGKDVMETRAPQAYGVCTLDALCSFM